MLSNDDKDDEYSMVGKKSKDNSIISYEQEFDINNGQHENVNTHLQKQLQISKTIYKVVEHEIPYKVYYIDERLGQICFGTLKGSDINPIKEHY